MTRYVALLRGVNVGGITIKMVDLARVFTELGFGAVKTVLASGNVLFDATADAATLTSSIEAALRREFDYEAWVFVLPVDELRQIVDACPFERHPDRHSYVIISPDPVVTAELSSCALDPEVEQLAPGDGVLYWQVNKGSTVSSVFGRNTGRARYKSFTTTRNLNTVHKLLK